MIQEVNDIVKELEARNELFNTLNNNVDSSKVETIETIINKYGLLDTSIYNKSDVNKICEVLDLDINSNIRASSEILDKYIKSYIDDFYDMTNNQNEIRNNESVLYKKYIDLFTKNKFDDVFGDYDELDQLMNDLCLPVEDKWRLLKYIDNKNIESKEYGIQAINLNSKLGLYNATYLYNKELVDRVSDELSSINIDIDMIPSLASRLSDDNNYDEVHNIIVVLVLNELYKQLIESISNKDNDKINIVTEMINNTMKFISDVDNSIVDKCRNIIVEYEDLLNEEKNKGNDIKQYMNISIDDLEKVVSSRDKAIALKELPIVTSVKETMDNMEIMDKTSNDYVDCVRLLSNLYDAYKEIKE